MLLNDHSYIILPERTGNLETDVKILLESNGKNATYAHVVSVAAAITEIAEKFRLDVQACRTAALLHDISAVITPNDMLSYAEANHLELCEAELRFPFLLHQRMSRIVAEEHFSISDQSILSAIECHTTLRPNASMQDMALFIADKIAWDQPGTPPFYASVHKALDCSLPSACLEYMTYMVDNDRILCPHTLWTLSFSMLHNELRLT